MSPMAGAFLNGEDILVITAGFWDAAKRLRHKMPLQWAARGSRVLWLEQSPFPGPDWRAPGVLKRSLFGDVREVRPRLFAAAMPPALPRMYKSGLVGESIKGLQRPFYLRRLRRYLEALRFDPKVVVLFQQAARRDIFDLFKDKVCIYYHHDVYAFGYATEAQERALEACCRRADMVWCVAREHQEALLAYNPNTHFIPHAVDEEWFGSNRTRTPPEYAGAIPAPRLVYTGVFQDKMDLALLVEVAERRPKWQQVFVGPVELDRLDRSLLERLEGRGNVHFLGARDVDDLPGFMDGATALMLPYRPTPYARSAGLSLKFFEYLVSGKPILVAPFTRMQVSERLYYLADGADEWVAELDRLEDGDGEARQKERVAAAMENTYEARVQQQKRLLAPYLA
jgi:hypothetical protein